MRYSKLFLFSVLFSCSSGSKEATPTTEKDPRPNILYIMLDDLGFSDLGCYGSDWKITNQADAANNDLFQLYNLESDFSEQQNLATKQPEKLTELLADWEQYKKEVGVIFLEKMN